MQKQREIMLNFVLVNFFVQKMMKMYIVFVIK